MENTLSALLTTLLGYYLPISDVSVRISVSMAMTQLALFITKPLIEFIRNYVQKYYKNLSTTEIKISSSNPSHEKISRYLTKKFAHQISKYNLENERGINKLIPFEIGHNSIVDNFEHDEVMYRMNISLGNEEEKNNNSDKNSNPKKLMKSIHIESKGSKDIIESYIKKVCHDVGNIQFNKIPIYRTHIGSNGENRTIKWKSSTAKLSKNTTNTIVSKTVKTHFYDDIEYFMNAEDFYLKKGLPYKRGYLLHGEPGCGKTSLIKAVANQYSMPIFIIDLSTIENNAEFIKITSEINSFINQDEPYIVVYEDLDRSNMFKKWGCSRITIDCFLNILDGLDEYHSRITIITANDVNRITETRALVRPGRIDMIVELPKCETEQIKDILRFYFEKDSEYELNEDVCITPAQLTQIILSVKDIDRIVRLLNKHKDLSKKNITEVSAIYADNDLDINIDLEAIMKEANKDDDSEEEQTDVQIREGIVKDIKHNINQMDITIALHAENSIQYQRLALQKRVEEEKLKKAEHTLELAKYREANNIKKKSKRSKRSGRSVKN